MITIVGYRPLAIDYEALPPFANTKSLSFDGTDDRVLIPSSNWGADSFTISMWINPSVVTGFQMLLGGSGYSIGNGLGFYINGSTIHPWVSVGGVANGLFISASVLAVGTWTHLILVRNKNVGWDLYINGSLTDQSTIRKTEDFTSANSFLAKHYNDNYYYNGKMDEVCILDRIATPSEIAKLSSSPTVDLIDLNPISWYRMGDNGAWKSPQWLIPNNENKDKVSNYSIYTDGVDESVNIGSLTAIESVSNFSISFWIKQINITTQRYIFGTYVSGSNRFDAYQLTTGAVRLVLDGGRVYGDFDIRGQGWVNITAVFDGSLTGNINRLKCYVNGTDLTVNQLGTIPATTNVGGNDFKIGTMGGLATGHIGAYFNNFAVFDYSLTQQNVTDIYNLGTPNDLTSLSPTNWIKLGDNATFTGGVWTAPDEVGSNPGTSINMDIEDRIGEAPYSTNNALSFNMDEVDRVTDVPT
tara:strand:+ start:6586 stop:7995 length:1410 start_codon:yes stop_codon:yes gene_type:complete